jgi:adenylate cyclase
VDSIKVFLLVEMGSIYVNSSPDSFYYYVNNGIQIAQKLQDPKEEAICLSTIATTLSYIGSFPDALSISLKSLKLAEQIKDQKAIELAFNSLGNIYYSQNDFRNSLKYFVNTLAIAQSIHE